MKYISHRINTLDDLKGLDTHYGAEVDIRTRGKELIIHHDPFVDGEPFLPWVERYCHGTLILNVKEEGLESRLIELMQKHNIEDYFLLDQSFPFLVKWSKKGLRQSAVRVSEYETIETALTLSGKVDWCWVDCFTKFPINGDQAKALQSAGFKLCLVSPELQGRSANEIHQLHQLLVKEEIFADAVCTKQPRVWEQLNQN